MRVVVDTNVVISGVFFGGKPRRIIEAIADERLYAYATPAIIDEYIEVVHEMLMRKQGKLHSDVLMWLVDRMTIFEPVSSVSVCRDPDDDKFIGCALDARARYIISGDKDLLEVEEYQGVKIIAAHNFCQKYL